MDTVFSVIETSMFIPHSSLGWMAILGAFVVSTHSGCYVSACVILPIQAGIGVFAPRWRGGGQDRRSRIESLVGQR